MQLSQRVSMRLFILTCAVFALSAAMPALADNYTDYVVATSPGSIDNMGFTGDGRSLVLTLNSGCGLGSVPCYQTFTPPSTSTLSTTEPTLTDGNGPGGYSVFETDPSGNLHDIELYVSYEGTDTLIAEGQLSPGQLYVNSYGDVAYYVYNTLQGDANVLAVNTSATPEPSGIVLLGTAILAAGLFISRRRLTTIGRA